MLIIRGWMLEGFMKTLLIASVILALTVSSHGKGVYNPQGKPVKEIVALTLLMESRGEGQIGMNAVFNVIVNRSKYDDANFIKVCLRRLQFSCWNGSLPLNKALKLLSSQEGHFALSLVQRYISGQPVKNYVLSSDHYCTLDSFPSWRSKFKVIAIIGNHIFFDSKQPADGQPPLIMITRAELNKGNLYVSN